MEKTLWWKKHFVPSLVICIILTFLFFSQLQELEKELTENQRKRVQLLAQALLELNTFELRYFSTALREKVFKTSGINPLKLNLDWPTVKQLGNKSISPPLLTLLSQILEAGLLPTPTGSYNKKLLPNFGPLVNKDSLNCSVVLLSVLEVVSLLVPLLDKLPLLLLKKLRKKRSK